MEGRTSTGVATIFANCEDLDTRRAEFTKWYNTVHVPDVTVHGIFVNCTRFENPSAQDTVGSPRFFAVYETYRDDPVMAWSENRVRNEPLRAQGRLYSNIKTTVVAVWKRIGPQPAPAMGKETRGIYVVLADCKDPTREAEFNRWYDDMHLPDVMGTGLFFTATRFVNAGVVYPERKLHPVLAKWETHAFHGNQPRYMTIYETHLDPFEAVQRLRPAMNALAQKGRATNLIESRLGSAFGLVFSQARGQAFEAVGPSR